ncbi:hypothetical protein [uncultured Paracoccus sp.]|uniref:hypothetical protein n=1 Tax=uncultured Paracoccus sp. TaxID=189685 RepID=UPI002629DE40|nr:hypothetical protein [uncultured Paracoccus sp.]
MSGVLQRLVARATGAETPGLRPRLPGMFEGGAGALGFREIADEVVAPQVPEARQAESVPPHTQFRPAAPAEHANPPARPAPLLPPTQAPSQPPTVAAQSAVIEPTAIADRPPAVSFKPAAPRVSTVTPTLAPDPMRPAPLPLLQVQPPERLEHSITTRLVETMPARPHSAPHQPADAAPEPEPEITIHIGRLDIRSEPPAPRSAPRPSPQASLPSLADYLRGVRR